MVLPADLRSAEVELLAAAQAALASAQRGLWTLELRFEGLRLLPVALRLLEGLGDDPSTKLLCADAGAAALARRDAPQFAERVTSLKDHQRLQQADGGSDGLLLLHMPSPADYELVQDLCQQHRGSVLMLNGSLEDAAVGIGSVARDRRRGFLTAWASAYALLPRTDGALKHRWPDDWELYRLDPDGYRLAAQFADKPDGDQLAEALMNSNALGRGLDAVDRFVDGLRR